MVAVLHRIVRRQVDLSVSMSQTAWNTTYSAVLRQLVHCLLAAPAGLAQGGVVRAQPTTDASLQPAHGVWHP